MKGFQLIIRTIEKEQVEPTQKPSVQEKQRAERSVTESELWLKIKIIEAKEIK